MAEDTRKIVLEILAKTDSFQRDMAKTGKSFESLDRVVKKNSGTFDSFTRGYKALSAALRMGAFTYAANSIMNTVTAMDQARRKGESMFEAFISGLPIINRLAESARNMADSLSGLTEATEIFTATQKLSAGIKDIQRDIERSIALLSAATIEEKNRLNVMFKYEDRLKTIGQLEYKESERINLYNKRIDEQIAALEKLRGARTEMAIGGFGAMGYAPKGMSDEEINRRINELEVQKLNIEGFGSGVRKLAETEKNLAEQFKGNMDVKIRVHAEGMDRIVAQESEAAQFIRGYQEETKRNWMTMWDPVIDGSMNASDVIKSFFKNLLTQIIQARIQLQMLNLWNAGAGGVLGGFFAAGGRRTFTNPMAVYGAPAAELHRGGIVGEPAPKRWVNSRVFENAPRYHDLLPGEVAVIAQKGEKISRPGGSSNMPVIVFNNNGPPVQQKGPAKFDGEKIIIELEAAMSDRMGRRAGPLYQAIKGVK